MKNALAGLARSPAGVESRGMSSPGYAYSTVAETVAALRRGEVSSLELTDAAIARIERYDGTLNAVVVRDFARARDAAKSADAARARGVEGPLLGVPITVKESFDLAGHPTTWGLEVFREHRAVEDAAVVQRLKVAGAVVLGKTNDPVALADWQSFNPNYGRTVNPWNTARSAGGSSGGSAVALAAGYVSLEMGSDIGGSVRVPAAFNGVYGHKPTYGIVPMRGHAPGGFAGAPVPLVAAGPLARSAGDLATALEVVAGADGSDARAWRLALPPSRISSLKGALPRRLRCRRVAARRPGDRRLRRGPDDDRFRRARREGVHPATAFSSPSRLSRADPARGCRSSLGGPPRVTRSPSAPGMRTKTASAIKTASWPVRTSRGR